MLTRRIVDQILPGRVSPNRVQRTSTPGGILALGMIAACLVAELVVLNVGIDDLDEGYFVQQAVRVLQGQVPYRDFETLYSPGLAYLHAGLFALLGGPSLVAPRALALIGRAGIASLLYVFARPLVRQPLWAAAPALVLLLGFDDAPRWEPHPGWLSTLFALVSVWCLTRARSARWLMASGVAAAAAYAFKQNTGVFILAAVLLWCGRSRFLLPLGAFIAASVLWVLPLGIAIGGQLGALRVLVGAVNQAGLWSAPDPTNAIPLACLVGGAWLVRGERDWRLRWYMLAGTGLFLTEFPRMDTVHLVWSAPLLLVLGAITLDRLRPSMSTLAILVTVILLAPTWSSRLAYLAEPRARIDGVEAPLSTAADIQGAVDEIQRRTQPGEPIFVYPTSPLLYVLADRPNPTRFDHLNPGAVTTRQLDVVTSDVRSNVRLVVISDFWETAWGTSSANALLEDWLNSHFTEVARHGPYRVLATDL
jgi:hypothetical protein